jgi:glyoxylase-like metal-dependent hydrolase (beta-lactamase superfamily II)
MNASDLAELRPGLLRWTTRHPLGTDSPEPESPDDWPPDVGCVAYEGPDALVLIDPLVPDDEQGRALWEALDARVEACGGRAAVLTTIHFHTRSRDAAIERYGASTSPPAGVTAIPIARAREQMFWIEEHRALVAGDRLLGDGAGGVRMCPESWLGYLESGLTLAELRQALLPLLDLPVEMVLVSHREPVLRGGREAIERALR